MYPCAEGIEIKGLFLSYLRWSWTDGEMKVARYGDKIGGIGAR